MKAVKLFMILYLLPCISFAQLNQVAIDLATAEMKYWKLKGRLTGDENNLNIYSGFTSVGNAKGQSLPFNRRPMNTIIL